MSKLVDVNSDSFSKYADSWGKNALGQYGANASLMSTSIFTLTNDYSTNPVANNDYSYASQAAYASTTSDTGLPGWMNNIIDGCKKIAATPYKIVTNAINTGVDTVRTGLSKPITVAGNIPEEFKKLGYNEQRGISFANSALQTAKEMIGSRGMCYKGVKTTLRRLGIDNLTGGSAYMAADQLARRSDFKEVSISKADLKNLPAGAIVVWGKGNTENTQHGHISVSVGDGREISDHIANQYKNLGNGTIRVFIPV